MLWISDRVIFPQTTTLSCHLLLGVNKKEKFDLKDQSQKSENQEITLPMPDLFLRRRIFKNKLQLREYLDLNKDRLNILLNEQILEPTLA